MSEQRLRQALRELEAPEAGAARARALETALGARAGRPANPWPARLRPLAVVVCAAVAVVLALTPPGDAVGKWFHRIVSPRPAAGPAAAHILPAPGRVLVAAGGQAWIVKSDGHRTALGRWDGVSWSPHGLFVAAWHGQTLAALDPQGHVRWSVTAPAPVRAAAWSPQGFHVVYLAGHDLRVVSGQGRGDSPLRHAPKAGDPRRVAASGVAAIAPVFRPGVPRTLAFVDGSRRVEVVDVYTGALRWRSRGPVASGIRALAWTGDGTRLVALSARSLQRWTASGRSLGRTRLAAGREGLTLAPAPRGRRVALAEIDRATGRGEVVLAGSARAPLFDGRGRFAGLAWSPDGRWLLVSWPAADQWVFLRTDRRSLGGVAAMRGIAGRFGGPAPALGGWCCSAP